MTSKTTKVAPIPRGFRSLTPHILVADVSAAVALYQRALGATEVSAETIPGDDTVIFALLRVGNSVLTLGQGDAFGPGYVSLHHYVEDFDTTWKRALEAGFVEVAAPSETYWGDRMGLLTDPLGVRWSIAQRVVRLTPAERVEKALQSVGNAAAPVAEPVATDVSKTVSEPAATETAATETA